MLNYLFTTSFYLKFKLIFLDDLFFMLKLKRIYEKPEKGDGYRILVDRLWPRGVSKEKAQLDLWLKDIAPSTELRKWFAHDPAKWSEFQKRYKKELAKQTEAIALLKSLLKKEKIVTFLFATKDKEHNEAVVIKDFLK